MKIDRNSYKPMYKQIADDLQKKIQERLFEIGEQLPTEPELMEEYQVSRITVRKAVNLLVEKRLITIQRGKGMFVNAPTMETDVLDDVMNVENFKGFYETLVDQGIDARIKFLKFDEHVPPKNISESMNCPENVKLRAIERIFYIKDLPIAYQIGYISPHINIDQQKLMNHIENQPLSKLIQIRYQLKEIRCSLAMKQTPASISELLHIAPEFPLLTLSRIFINDNSEPFVASLLYLSSDSYQFTIKNQDE